MYETWVGIQTLPPPLMEGVWLRLQQEASLPNFLGWGKTVPSLVNAVEMLAASLLPHLHPLSSHASQKALLVTFVIYPPWDPCVLRKRFQQVPWFFTVCLGGVFRLQTPLWKRLSPGCVDISLGPELLYQFFITSYFLFMMPMGSLKMTLPIGDTSKAFSQFLKNQVVRADMNILILRKSRAFIELNLLWNLSDRLNRMPSNSVG